MELTEPIEREVSARKKTKILDVTPAKVRVLRSILQDKSELWNIKIKDIQMGILALCQINMRRNSGAGYILDDRILFRSLVDLLGCGNKEVESRAALILINNVYFQWLEEEENNIKQTIPYSTIPEITKLKLLTLCTRGKERKMLIGHELYEQLEYGYKVRLGDSSAEGKLLSYSDSIVTYAGAVIHLKQLFVGGSPKCLKAAIDFFNQDFSIQEEKGINLRSIRPEIIAGFARLHPGDTLLFNELIRQKLQSDDVYRHAGSIYGKKYRKIDGKYTEKTVDEYIKSINEWFLENYNHKPAGVNEKPMLFYWVENVENKK
ncbi:MAG: hypothetical protein ACOC4C_03240 [Fibrobacterota bacterium]